MMPMAQTISADHVGGAIWIAFGAAVIYGSWMMDRLESLGIPPATAPGVVPGLLGIGIIIFGLVLAVRRSPAGRSAAAADSAGPTVAEAEPAPHTDEFHWKRVLLSWMLC